MLKSVNTVPGFSNITVVYVVYNSLSLCVLVGFILCHAALNSDPAALSLWKLALQSSSCLCLFRDEVFHIHKAAEDLFVNIRGSAISSGTHILTFSIINLHNVCNINVMFKLS